MKFSLCLAVLPFAGVLGRSPAFLGRANRTPLALVAKGGTYATGDGGSGSASFKGDAPKGGTALKDAVNGLFDMFKGEDVPDKVDKEASKVTFIKGGSDDNGKWHVGPFWESDVCKEAGLGFVLGVGTAVVLKKSSKKYAYAVGGTCALAQFLSRSDFMGCGGKLGWSKLSDDELSPCERETCPCVWRTMRILKHTIVGAVPSGAGFAAGFYGALKTGKI